MHETNPLATWLPSPCVNRTVHTANADQLNTQLAQDIAQRLDLAIQARGFAVLSVSGGKSPIPLFEALRVQLIDWSRVRVTLVDERCVPCTHPDSNALLVQTHLLQEHAHAARFIPMVRETAPPIASPQVQAQAASLALQAAGTTDVLVLGMGADGHTASLFPQALNLSEALERNTQQACIAMTLASLPANAPYQRITQSLAQLLHARHIVLPLSGAEKLNTLRQALERLNPQYPVSYVLHQTETPVALWITP